MDDLHEVAGRLKGPMRKILDRILENIDDAHVVQEITMNCPLDVAIENTLEDVHVPFVHANTFASLGLCDAQMERHGSDSIAIYRISNKRVVDGLSKIGTYFLHPQPSQYVHMFISPDVCLSSVANLSYSLQRYLPETPNRTICQTTLYRARVREDAPNIRWFFDSAARFNRQVFEEDARVCASVLPGEGNLTEAERRIAWYRESRY